MGFWGGLQAIFIGSYILIFFSFPNIFTLLEFLFISEYSNFTYICVYIFFIFLFLKRSPKLDVSGFKIPISESTAELAFPDFRA